VAKIDCISLQVPSDLAKITISNLCLTGITFK
jgi:hypothetical protein